MLEWKCFFFWSWFIVEYGNTQVAGQTLKMILLTLHGCEFLLSSDQLRVWFYEKKPAMDIFVLTKQVHQIIRQYTKFKVSNMGTC